MNIDPPALSDSKRILIFDSQENSLNLLSPLLAGYFRKNELIYSVQNHSEAIQVIQMHHPSLIFMDYNLDYDNKIEVLNTISSETTQVVFLLEASDPAAEAFRFFGIKFLSKPIDIDDLVSLMDKMCAEQKLKSPELAHQYNPCDRLTLKSQEGVTCVELDHIRRLESDSNYTHFFLTTGEKITTPRTLKEYENILSDSHFFRTHQSHIVNLKRVKKFLKEDGGYALMDDGTHVLVSRRKKNGFLCALTA